MSVIKDLWKGKYLAGSVADKKGVASTSMTVAGDRGQEAKDSLTKGPNSAPAAGLSPLSQITLPI